MSQQKSPDWKALTANSDEVAALQAAGRWTKAEFTRLYAERMKACNGHERFLEAIINEAPPEWRR
jgi:hypothetical protein